MRFWLGRVPAHTPAPTKERAMTDPLPDIAFEPVALAMAHAATPAWRFFYSTIRGIGHGWTDDNGPFYACKVD
jgi:hypothetical protein